MGALLLAARQGTERIQQRRQVAEIGRGMGPEFRLANVAEQARRGVAATVGAAVLHQVGNTGSRKIRGGTAGIQSRARIVRERAEHGAHDVDALLFGLAGEEVAQ
jgi:hypothetical protein